ncbi:MAG: DUF4249 domain-containing protein [Prevotella sp.]|jgi:hypothetical protein|nr:DUF4249 domain-containing protein [Prevotella sp.]
MANKLWIIILLLSFISCEEVVNIDLKESEPKIVIDANITDSSPCFIILTESQGFNNNKPSKRISGATIELYDGRGNKETVKETKEKGIYMSLMTGRTGGTYTLNVSIGGEKYEAKATIPEAVPVDSLYIYNIRIGKDDWYSPCIIFQDPAREKNYYYTMMYVNGTMMRSIYLNDDEFRNGLVVERILYFDKEDNDDEKLKIGDHVRVEMQTLDKGMYTFYRSLHSVAAGGATNPLTNFTGEALGCFKAYGASYKEITISKGHIYTK